MTDIHLVRTTGDKKTICGLKDIHGPAVPYMLAEHRHGRISVKFCPDCLEGVGS